MNHTTLYYAPLDLLEDISEMKTKSISSLQGLLADFIIGKEGKVFLLAFEDDDRHSEIFVFDKYSRFLEHKCFSVYNKVFLQEYSSYEEAYKVALDMREPNPLCYNK
jgi:hypothetical protein